MHINPDIYGETRYGTPAPLRYPLYQMALTFFGVVGGLAFLAWWFEDKKHFQPAMPKQWPNKGQKHYTFEPAR